MTVLGRSSSTRRDLLAFAAVGVAGFAVDASVMTLLVERLMWHPVQGRAVSFPLAVTTTWLLNRGLAFRGMGPRSRSAEYAGYVVIQIVGALVNVGVFLACISLMPSLVRAPVVPLAAGAAVALLLNFALLRGIVYRDQRHEQPSADQD
jgi:putative flippase GtrA